MDFIPDMIIDQTLKDIKLSPLDAEIILSYAIKKPKEYLFAHPEKKLTPLQLRKFKSLAVRRVKGEPIAYLICRKEFYGFDFYVNKNVLIPRPETELLVDEVLAHVQNAEYKIPDTKIIDVGTGSGNIIISIARNLRRNISKKIEFLGTDISPSALKVARRNAKSHRVIKKIKFIKSDLLDFIYEAPEADTQSIHSFLRVSPTLHNFDDGASKIPVSRKSGIHSTSLYSRFYAKRGKQKKSKKHKHIIIVANLPYLSRSLYEKCSKDIKDHEPREALISSSKGLNYYRKLIKQIETFIQITNYELPITVFLEISPEQRKPISKIIKERLPQAKTAFKKDLTGKWRVVSAKLEL